MKRYLLIFLLVYNLCSYSQTNAGKRKIIQLFYDLPVDASFEKLKELIFKDSLRLGGTYYADSVFKEVYAYVRPGDTMNSCKCNRLKLIQGIKSKSNNRNKISIYFGCSTFTDAGSAYDKFTKEYAGLFAYSKEEKGESSGKKMLYYAHRFSKRPVMAIGYHDMACLVQSGVWIDYFRY